MGEILAVLIPVVAIAFVLGEMARRKLERGKQETTQLQDEDFLSVGSPRVSAHLEAILERLTSLEGRIQALEEQRTAQPRGGTIGMWEDETRSSVEAAERRAEEHRA
jgi:hypothetical protein